MDAPEVSLCQFPTKWSLKIGVYVSKRWSFVGKIRVSFVGVVVFRTSVVE